MPPLLSGQRGDRFAVAVRLPGRSGKAEAGRIVVHQRDVFH